VANRIVTVGDAERARKLSLLLDKIHFTVCSTRGFTTYTGVKNNVPITIMAIGMGLPMMDFMVREVMEVVEGHLCIIRFGTCGTPNIDTNIGTIAVADSSVCVTTNFDASRGTSSVEPYFISLPVSGCPELIESLKNNLEMKENTVKVGLDVTCDSFYGSQDSIIILRIEIQN